MSSTPTASAKERVLAWVREKNPQTMEIGIGVRCRIKNSHFSTKTHEILIGDRYVYYDTEFVIDSDMNRDNEDPYCIIVEILGTDMGLQELLIAIREGIEDNGAVQDRIIYGMFDLTQNLHNQAEEFYESLLPLLK